MPKPALATTISSFPQRRVDSATARSYYTVMQQTDALPLQPIICGRYHDTFARRGGEWRFTDRLIFSDLIGDLSQHLLVDVYGGGST